MKHSLRLILITKLLIIIFVVGCSQATSIEKSDTIVESSNGETMDKNNNDELIIALGSEPETGFDPTTGWGRYGSPLFQSTLFKRDNELNIINDLAVNYTISEDGLVWIVELRDDVKFSDGKSLTANDVVYTFESASTSGSIIDLNNLSHVEAINELTVQFSLKEAQSTFINALINTGIVPKYVHGKDYAENPIGSGPFSFVQWDKGQQLIVKSNPNYYGEKPFFNKVTFLFLKEDAAFAAAKSGQVHMVTNPPAFSKQKVNGMRLEALRTVDNRGVMFPFVNSGEKTVEGYPIGNDVTADIAIRKAINIAIDRHLLVEGILEGHGTPAYTVADGLPWWNPESMIEDADIEEAKSILEEAGWVNINDDGILQKNSLNAEFILMYPANDFTRQSLAIAVADLIKPIGINIIVEGKSWDDIQKHMYSNAVLFGWGSHDPIEIYNIYSSSTAGEGWYNTGFYNNSEVDGYLEKALSTTNIEKSLEYWKKAQWDGQTGFSAKGDAPWAWLGNLDHLYLVDEKLDIGHQRIQPHQHGWPITDNITEWKWIN